MSTRIDIPVPICSAEKMRRLVELLQSYGSVAIGFSGGVDSTFLAAVCVRALPPSRVHLIHLDTPLVGTPERTSFERERKRFERLGAHVVSIEVDPLLDPTVATNPADRCYHCKRLGFQRIMDVAREVGAHVVLEGSNVDDAGDYRPGTRAVRDLGAQSPLMETGWSKAEEREVLRAWGHEVWSLPAGACLATRIPCGETLTKEKLHVVRACEDYLHDLGFEQVRVRLDAGTARVSLGEDELDSPLLQNAQAGGRALPQRIIDELGRRGAQRVDPVVRAYIHGEGNGSATRGDAQRAHLQCPEPLQRSGPVLASSDTDNVLHGGHENLSIPDLPRSGCIANDPH